MGCASSKLKRDHNGAGAVNDGVLVHAAKEGHRESTLEIDRDGAGDRTSGTPRAAGAAEEGHGSIKRENGGDMVRAAIGGTRMKAADETILPAYCLDSIDVPPVMIKINRGTDINSAYGLILKALYSRGYTGIEERDEEGKEIFVSKIMHGGFVSELNDLCDFHGFSGEPMLYRLGTFVNKKGQAMIPINIKTLYGKTIALLVNQHGTVAGLKQDIQDKEGIPPDQMRLVFKGMQLDDRCKLLQYNIAERATIHLVLRLRGGGITPGHFADVSDASGLTEHAWNPDAPSWRRAKPGLCLSGECRNRSCSAHGWMVILNHGFEDFDLMRNAGTGMHCFNCPQCFEIVVPSTCGFNNCVWRYKGRKAGETNILVGPWKEAGDSYHCFEEGKQVAWERLLIQARPLPGHEVNEGSDGAAAAAAATTTTTTTTTATINVSVAIDHTYGRCTRCYGCMSGPGRDRTVLGCGHRFHSDCLRGWENGAMVVCPNCREESSPRAQ